MSQDTRYDGWTNYETWRVNLEICDDYCGTHARGVENGHEDRFNSVSSLSSTLKEYVTDMVCGEDYHAENLVTQYAMAFIDHVNWDEIARHWEPELIVTDHEITVDRLGVNDEPDDLATYYTPREL